MPKDDWASTRRRDAVRRANAPLDASEAIDRKPKPVKRRNKQRPKRLVCPRCNILAEVNSVTFRNGTKHLEARCLTCGRFLGYVKRRQSR